MSIPTPSSNPHLSMRRADFATLTEALDYAARGETGLNFYSGKGELVEALPYRDLRQQAMALARRLLNAGLERGERVALIADRSEEHTSELQSLMRISYAVFCLHKKKQTL